MKTETKFINQIHSKLKQLPNPPFIYKIAERFRNGIPDALYIGPSGITLWVEYKIHPNKLSKIQSETIDTLNNYKQTTAVLTHTPTCTIITAGDMIMQNNEPWRWIANTLGYTHATTHSTWPQRSPMDC